jgi:hypothetical protein
LARLIYTGKEKRRKQFLFLSILTARSKGHNIRKIAATYQISTWQVQRVLHTLNQDAKHELANYLVSELPLQFIASISLLRSIIDTADQMVAITKNEAIRLDCLNLMRDCNESINAQMVEASNVSDAINRIERSNLNSTQLEAEQEVETKQLYNKIRSSSLTTNKDGHT